MLKSVTLGPEHDQELRTTLGRVLEEAGAVRFDHTWRVVGSQEIETWLYHFGIYGLTIEAETYMGLTLHGPTDLVDQVVEAVQARYPA